MFGSESEEPTMKRSVLIATIVAAIALIPVAMWQDDLLVLSFAGLIPFCVDWKNGDLN